jgi:hypothetical protein
MISRALRRAASIGTVDISNCVDLEFSLQTQGSERACRAAGKVEALARCGGRLSMCTLRTKADRSCCGVRSAIIAMCDKCQELEKKIEPLSPDHGESARCPACGGDHKAN